MNKDILETGIFTNESIDEFWSATCRGNTVTIHFGKIGRMGTKASREFSTINEAREFLYERLKDKIAKGFVKKRK